MSKKILWLIVIIVFVLIIAAGLWWGFKNGSIIPSKIFNPSSSTTSTPQVGLEDIAPVVTNATDQSLLQSSRGWAERYATYSNHDNYQNFSELSSVMTDFMLSQTQTFISQLRSAHNPDDPYWGITSHALAASIISGSAASGQIQIKVILSRQEIGQNLDKTYQQDLIFDIIKADSNWKINNAQLKSL